MILKQKFCSPFIFCDAAVKLLLHGDESLDLVADTLMLNTSVDFILSSKRFEV